MLTSHSLVEAGQGLFQSELDGLFVDDLNADFFPTAFALGELFSILDHEPGACLRRTHFGV